MCISDYFEEIIMPLNSNDPTLIDKILGEDRFISASQILDYEKCPFYYLLARVYKLKGGNSPDWGANLGKAIHDWHEGYFNVIRSFEDLKKAYESNLGITNESYCKNLILAELKYMHEKGRKASVPVFTEMEFEIDHFTGRIDRLEIRPDGNLTVVEVKPKVNQKYSKNQRWQLTFYAMQINKMMEKGIKGIPAGAKVTHGRVIGYKDASQAEFKINGQSIAAINKRIKLIRNSERFPMNYGIPLCKYCEYESTHCTEAALKEIEGNW